MHITKMDIQVRYYETDRMGIVHHSNYLRYFELVRTQFMEEIGLNYPQLEAAGLMSPVVTASCAYKKPCTYGDTITLTCQIAELTKARTRFVYEVWNGDDLLVTGETSHTFVDQHFRVVPTGRKYPEIQAKLKAAAE